MYPADYLYSKEHEWIKVAGDIGTIGITDFAQSELGDVVFVELPQVGRKLKEHESLGSVESVKAVSDIYSPVSGVVTEVNAALASARGTIPLLGVRQAEAGKPPKAWAVALAVPEPTGR